ncbi:MAG TPA: GNAT family N-acetyltransferase [Kineosporiaceae bacterium]|jgi:GNAT superfamily N-acetyltransferase|nr:GNAT family N-acetyltransferase [Kineosporiaceae bacterium]
MLKCELLPAGQGVSTAVVRPAEQSEWGAIRDVLNLAYAQYVGDVAPEAWERFRADLLDLDRHARHGRLLVALVDGDVAGYAAFYPDAAAQGLGWPAGWAGGRGLAVHPSRRGHGIAVALMAALEGCARARGAPVFAFHTSSFMTSARALYERLGYRRAPEFDLDLNSHYGVTAAPPWTALAYLARVGAARPESPQRRWRTEKAS